MPPLPMVEEAQGKRVRRNMARGCLVLGSILFALCILLMIAAVWSIVSDDSERQASEIEMELRRDVPLGSEREVVTAWFERKGYSYSFWPADPQGVHERFSRPHYRALLVDVSSTFMSRTNLWVYVIVDEEGRAVEHKVEVWMITI